ncbi:unnamed protein product [Brassicogethes aeneus]|uniref:Integrin beta n=1 Tax=Brassicogethes aeneus TaxID=1431903 RepID=A0A9P0B7E0_BRAAE|nr:unnamed protein product [Brassicogethes aeneus]
MLSVKFAIFSVFLFVHFKHLNADCIKKKLCSACIQEPGCGWCEIAQSSSTFREVHCLNETSELAKNCSGFYTITSSKADMNNEPLSSKINLKPQKIVVNLTKNQEYKFNFLYQQPSDYPVDLYFIMDMSKSMIKVKKTIANLGKSISEKLNKLTNNSRIGFGSFIDKPCLPFQNTGELNYKRMTYSFKNNLPLTNNSEKFKKAVKEALALSNLDTPESGFDALMQAMVCKKEINWRDDSRHIIILATDALSHMAGSGRLAGIVVPSDGKCHLHNGVYNESLNFDYPSLSHINYIARQEKKYIIFYVNSNVREPYSFLSKEIENSDVSIMGDGTNINSVIEKNYINIVSTTKMQYDAPDNVKITFTSNCTNPSKKGCKGVKIGEVLNFTATIHAESCPPNNASQIIKVYPDGISKEGLTIELNILCDCECQKKNSSRSDQCNKQGRLICGLCECDDGFIGKQCQCAGNSNMNIDNKNCLGPNRKECSGRGTCKCGQCVCDTTKNPDKDVISGDFCECDNFNCDRANGQLCAGNGVCECGKCRCKTGWTGRDCNCKSSQDECKNDKGVVCSDNGKCKCNACVCDRKYSGKHCDDKITTAQRCDSFKDCVECQGFKTGKYDRMGCKTNCTKFITKLVKEFDETHSATPCVHFNKDNCEIWFRYTEDFIVEALDEPNCRKNILWMLIFGVMGSILLAGIVLLLMWKIGTTIHDKREFSKFEQEQKGMKWGTGENPLFVKASTDYSNPAYGRRSMRLNS